MEAQARAVKAAHKVLGILLSHPDMVPQAIATISDEEMACAPEVLEIWLAIRECQSKRGKATAGWVAQELARRNPNLRPDHLLHLMQQSWISRQEYEPALEDLRDAARRRRIAAVAEHLKAIASDEELATAAELDEAVRAEVAALLERSEDSSHGPVALAKPVADLVADMKARREGRPPQRRRIRVGWARTLDYQVGGFSVGDLVVLAARPSMGKSSLALAWALHVARTQGPVLYVSAEMSAEALAQRVLQREGPLPSGVWHAEPSQEQLRRAETVLAEAQQLPFWIYDRRGATPADIAAIAHAVALQAGGMSLLVVDHLTELGRPRGSDRNPVQYLGDVARQLRALGQQLGCVVLLLAQLNRGVEARDDKRPKMSDLRESGQIEEVADVILLLYRHAYYHPEDESIRCVAEVEIAKNRHGQRGTVLCKWTGEYMRFDELSPDEMRQYSHVVDNAKSSAPDTKQQRSGKVVAMRRNDMPF